MMTTRDQNCRSELEATVRRVARPDFPIDLVGIMAELGVDRGELEARLETLLAMLDAEEMAEAEADLAAGRAHALDEVVGEVRAAGRLPGGDSR